MTLAINEIHEGDCLELMKDIPDKSVDLIVIDPPYNIGKDNRWDKWETVDAYVEFMTEVFKESERVLKTTGSFYWFHNDMLQVRKLMDVMDLDTSFIFKNFIIWNKRYEGSRRKYYFDNVIKTESSRSYRPLTEYCLFYTNMIEDTGLNWVLTNALKDVRKYLNDARKEKNITLKLINEKLGVATNGGGRASSIFTNPSTLQFPLEKYYVVIKELLELDKTYEELKDFYEEKRVYYDSLQKQHEQRYTYNHQATHHDVWDYEVAPKLGHVTPKPVEMIENIIRHSSNEGDTVLDCFLGSGTTAIAAINTNRNFIGIEREPEYVAIARQRISDAMQTEVSGGESA